MATRYDDHVSTDRRLDVHECDRSLVLMDDAGFSLSRRQEARLTIVHRAGSYEELRRPDTNGNADERASPKPVFGYHL
jgi:hypothetical protein